MADPSSAMAACEQRIREEPVRRVGTWRERLRRSGPAGGDQGRGNIIGRRAGPSQRQHVTAGVDATSELRIGGEHGSLPDTSDAAGRRTFQRRVTLGDRSVCAVRAEDQPARGSASDQLGCPPLRGGHHRTRASAAPATRSPIHAVRLFISAMIHRYVAGCVGATGRVCEGHMKGGVRSSQACTNAGSVALRRSATALVTSRSRSGRVFRGRPRSPPGRRRFRHSRP